MQERFVVRTCGCHRGPDSTKTILTSLATSRPAAIKIAERVGTLERGPVRNFLEGAHDDLYLSSGEGRCPLNGSFGHWAAVFPITEG